MSVNSLQKKVYKSVLTLTYLVGAKNTKKEKKDKVSLTLDKDILAAIDELSVQIARSRSDTINVVLKQVIGDANLLQNIKASGGTAIMGESK